MENPSILEREIADIERQLAEKKAALQARGEHAPGQEKALLHEVVREKIKEMTPSGPPPAQPPALSRPPVAPLPPPSSEPPSYLSAELKNKVQELVNTAFLKDLSTAIKEAYGVGNAALLDAFHDVLVDQLYEELIKREKLKKI